jgi:hypothetical protein
VADQNGQASLYVLRRCPLSRKIVQKNCDCSSDEKISEKGELVKPRLKTQGHMKNNLRKISNAARE